MRALLVSLDGLTTIVEAEKDQTSIHRFVAAPLPNYDPMTMKPSLIRQRIYNRNERLGGVYDLVVFYEVDTEKKEWEEVENLRKRVKAMEGRIWHLRSRIIDAQNAGITAFKNLLDFIDQG